MIACPMLINAKHPLARPVDESGLKAFSHAGYTVLLQPEAADALAALLEDIGGWQYIAVVSGYRPHSEQRRLYAQTLLERGELFTRRFVALPGCSEHESGLAADLALIQDGIDELTPHFPYEGICLRFRERATYFGWIQRYPKGAEGITGIAHEPWHFRYVGRKHALAMAEQGLALEQYVQGAKQWQA